MNRCSPRCWKFSSRFTIGTTPRGVPRTSSRFDAGSVLTRSTRRPLSASASEAWYARGWAHLFLGQAAEGVDALLHGLKLWGVGEAEIMALRDLYGAEGLAGLARTVADFFETQSVMFAPRPTDIAILRATAGQTDLAFAALDRAIARDDVYLLFLDVLPWFEALNNDPRWRPLVEKARPVR